MTSGMWRDFLDITLRSTAKEIPSYFIRYEDLILEPEQTLKNIFRLAFNTPDIDGTVLEASIQKITSTGLAGKQSYSLKAGTGKLHRQLDKYNEKNY